LNSVHIFTNPSPIPWLPDAEVIIILVEFNSHIHKSFANSLATSWPKFGKALIHSRMHRKKEGSLEYTERKKEAGHASHQRLSV